jgi:hypothetical protein
MKRARRERGVQRLLIVVGGVITLAALWFGRGDSSSSSRTSGNEEPAITQCPGGGSGSIPCKCVTDPLDD